MNVMTRAAIANDADRLTHADELILAGDYIAGGQMRQHVLQRQAQRLADLRASITRIDIVFADDDSLYGDAANDFCVDLETHLRKTFANAAVHIVYGSDGLNVRTTPEGDDEYEAVASVVDALKAEAVGRVEAAAEAAWEGCR